MTATVVDELLATRSPFSLRINGTWVRLEGVTPGAGRTVERARSEFETVDGHRYAQQAPRGNREWSLDWRYASPAAVAAVAVAAEAPGDVWLHDASAAAANMLDLRDCYGHAPAAPLVNCSGIPLRMIQAATTITTPVRGGVAYSIGGWSTRAVGVQLATCIFPGGSTFLNSAGPTARAWSFFTPAIDGDLQVVLSGSGWAATGLQLVEGALPPTWLAGERAVCKVAVADPGRTLQLVRGGRGLSDYSMTLREVG